MTPPMLKVVEKEPCGGRERWWRWATARWSSRPRCSRRGPESRGQLCCCHNLANVLNRLPRRLQPRQACAPRDDVRRVRDRQAALQGRVSRQVPQSGGVAVVRSCFQCSAENI
jgi:hypothetical protein